METPKSVDPIHSCGYMHPDTQACPPAKLSVLAENYCDDMIANLRRNVSADKQRRAA